MNKKTEEKLFRRLQEILGLVVFGVLPFLIGFGLLNLSVQFTDNFKMWFMFVFASIFIIIPALEIMTISFIRGLLTILNAIFPTIKWEKTMIYKW
jgi:hypothetical protein